MKWMNNVSRGFTWLLVGLTCVSGLLSGCARPADTGEDIQPLISSGQTASQPSQASFETKACDFQGSESAAQAKCGTLSVPENRQLKNGAKLSLSVTVLKSTAASAQADPLLFLITGAGASSRFAGFMRSFLGDSVSDRDLILFDMRGTGGSTPDLSCPEVSAVMDQAALLEQLPFSKPFTSAYDTAYQTCRDRLTKAGVNLDVYSSAEMAQDLEDLRLALGYRQVNVYAASYSTRVILEWMRRSPDAVRSAVMDGIVPPDVDGVAQEISASDAALQAFFQLCAAHDKCHATYPDLEADLYKLVEKLNTQEIQVEVSDLQSGRRYKVNINGDRFYDLVRTTVAASQPEALGQLPKMIKTASEGGYDLLKTMLPNYINMAAPSADIVQTLVYCREQVAQSSSARINEVIAKVPPQAAEFFRKRVERNAAVCAIWKPKTTPAVNIQPMTTKTPLLIFTGSVNWTVSAAWQADMKKNMKNAIIIPFASLSQTVLGRRGGSDCWGGMVSAFLKDPTAAVDGACASVPLSVTWITFF
jgi:pimeloyl-ACP methyl ester carboxylesterase